MHTIVRFLADVRQELHKVQWPSRHMTTRYTLLVISISIVMALYLGLLDHVFSSAITQIIAR